MSVIDIDNFVHPVCVCAHVCPRICIFAQTGNYIYKQAVWLQNTNPSLFQKWGFKLFNYAFLATSSVIAFMMSPPQYHTYTYTYIVHVQCSMLHICMYTLTQ